MTTASSGPLSRARLWQVSLFSSLLIVATLLVASVQSSRLFNDSLHPDLRAKAETLAKIVGVQFRRAADLNIPLGKLREGDAFLDSQKEGHAEILYLGFSSPEGRLLFASRGLKTRPGGFFEQVRVAHSREEEPSLARLGPTLDLVHPVVSQGRVIGQLHVGVDATYVEQQLQEIHTDIAITLFVTALLTLEVLMALLALLVGRPLGLLHRLFVLGAAGDFTRQVRLRLQDEATRALAMAGRLVLALNLRHDAVRERAGALRRAGRLDQAASEALEALGQRFRFRVPGAPVSLDEPGPGDLRLPLFVFLFGCELSRSFWPLYVKRLYQPGPWLSESVMVALPMALWVLAMVLFTPLAGRLLTRRGSRTALWVGMAPSALGLAMTGLASSLPTLFFWRVLTASGYGIVTATALLHVARTSRQGHGARGMGMFVGAGMAASVCGTAIGGILADRIGHGETFLVAAALVCLAMALVGLLTPGTGPMAPEASREVVKAGYLGLLRRGRVLLFILLAAMPTRLVLTGFLFYLTPLHLHELGFGEAAIGRLMMGYFLATVLATPGVSLLADRYGWHRALMLLGGLLSGLGVLLFAASQDTWALLTAVVLVGLGQALAATPLLACVPPLFAEECASFGLDALLSVLRIVERVGSLAGPLLAAVLLSTRGFVPGARLIGAGTLVITAGLAAYFSLHPLRPSSLSPRHP